MSNETKSQWEGLNLGAEIERQVGDLQLSPEEWHARAAESARRALTAANAYVHENPWPVIGSVAIVSVALGLLLARNRD